MCDFLKLHFSILHTLNIGLPSLLLNIFITVPIPRYLHTQTQTHTYFSFAPHTVLSYGYTVLKFSITTLGDFTYVKLQGK